VGESEKIGEGKQEAKAPDARSAQPPAPREPPAGVDAGVFGADPVPPQPILVQLVGGDDHSLKPFEEQTLAISRDALDISRRTYWVAIFAFLAALAAAVFVGVQVYEMTKQTQIFASQTEGANAGALVDEMNTRKQLFIAEAQAKAAESASENSAVAVKESIKFSKLDERPWFGISDFKVVQYDRDDPKQPFRLQIEFRNSGKTPARRIHVFGMFGIHNSRIEGPTDAEWKSFLTYYAEDSGRYIAAPNATRKYIVGDFGDGTENAMFRALFTQNFASIRAGSKYLSYFGQATYVDNDNKLHTTKFCLLLADTETKQLAHCGNGNDMD
jgi:hypothetical protein